MAGNTYHRHHYQKRNKKKIANSPIDKWIYFAVILGPLMTLPQVYDIWVMGKKEVSAISWAAYTVVAVIWLLYGMKHRERPIIIVQLLWIVLDVLIFVGILF